MNKNAPQSLFTDPDALMLATIPNALPDTHHFLLCMALQNALKNLGSLFGDREFKRDLARLLFNNDMDDFEVVWFKMIDVHDFYDNEWLQKIYEKREK